eukprot:CAMPEP_0116874016 /NCGR_PEP_ID=MMETSP0463-20121206/5391_1 /TAXON_ID=181622 /ORGANISM="Strombidinopsis sp, Strain SopsisLIS2011" /LENGTH=329 /DNA_ID=CAMNT_0004517065 /DNA_START=2629 /DNA_END=3618 /DNA_ORIENTATION=+
MNLRVRLFKAILSKDIGWFDNKNRAPGIITTMLIEDITQVNGLTTESVGLMTEAGLGLVISVALAFVFSWELGIICAFVSPLMVLGGLGSARLQFAQRQDQDYFKQANALLSDIVLNYRTVVSFGQKNVDFLVDRYAKHLMASHKSELKKAHVTGLFFGYSQAIRFAFIAFVFYVAAYITKEKGLDSERVFTGVYVIFVGAIGSGVTLAQMPPVSKAKAAAKEVYGTIEEETKIDPKQKGITELKEGRIQLKNVGFRYPSRKQYVLVNFNLTVEPNTSVALVGHSGSGKSTIASLLLRFYDATQGHVLVDGKDITEYSMEYLRTKIAIV